MYLTGIGSAVPDRSYTQTECWEAFQQAPGFDSLTPRSHALLKKVLLGANGIFTRHLAMTDLSEAFRLDPDVLHARFAKNAPLLSLHAASKALASARVTPDQLDAVLISTCTGYLCPGLTSYVSEALRLRPDVLALDLVGQGCGAAVPNARTAEALLAAGRAKHVLSICVEVCSAAMYLDDDPGVLISACLFGDGAAAAVWSCEPAAHARKIEWKTSESALVPAERDALRFEQRGGMLRNILTREVPTLAAIQVEALLVSMLGENGLGEEDIRGWILHAGGREVLAAMQARLGLSDADLHRSAGVLREFGNISSPLVLFVLEKAITDQAEGGWWWMCSFGAGFSCHGALLKVD